MSTQIVTTRRRVRRNVPRDLRPTIAAVEAPPPRPLLPLPPSPPEEPKPIQYEILIIPRFAIREEDVEVAYTAQTIDEAGAFQEAWLEDEGCAETTYVAIRVKGAGTTK